MVYVEYAIKILFSIAEEWEYVHHYGRGREWIINMDRSAFISNFTRFCSADVNKFMSVESP